MRFRNRPWLDPAAGLLAVFSAWAAVGAGGELLRLPAGILLALVLPGLELGRALIAGRVGAVRRLVLTLAFGLSADVLGGVLLNLTPAGLTAKTWAILLGTVTVLAGAVAWCRQRRLADQAGPTLPSPSRQLLFGLVGGALMALALVFAVVGGQASAGTGYVQLWALPRSSGATAVIGVHSIEPATARFSVVLRAGASILAHYEFQLRPGATWTRDVRLVKTGARIEVLLYRATSTIPYREVWLGLPG